ncbi:anti-sigma factor family protein [Streptomyces sp. NPDC059629]|uniref:anti-sigma factor family protein n=1 Tax=Streptomyces sp. NPDC059629 TaxID=3346889 RepID=UPI0036B522D6
MSTREHPKDEKLGAYVLGIIDSDERTALDEHTAGCEECRMELAALQEMEAALGEVPPEAFLEGPPEDGELLLQRTLRQVRSEQAGARRLQFIAGGVGVAAAAAALFFVGYTLGAGNPADSVTAAPPTASTAGVRVASATDSTTKASLRVLLAPTGDYVKVNAAVTGVPAGERCRLVVVSANGHRETALSWVVPENAGTATLPPAGQGGLDGAAAIDSRQIKEVLVENDQGKKFVSAAPS